LQVMQGKVCRDRKEQKCNPSQEVYPDFAQISLVLFKIKKMKESVINWIRSFYMHVKDGVRTFDQETFDQHAIYWTAGMFLVLILGSVLTWIISRFVMVQILNILVDKTRTHWDDYLVKNKFFRALAQLVPLMFMEYFLSIVFFQYPKI